MVGEYHLGGRLLLARVWAHRDGSGMLEKSGFRVSLDKVRPASGRPEFCLRRRDREVILITQAEWAIGNLAPAFCVSKLARKNNCQQTTAIAG